MTCSENMNNNPSVVKTSLEIELKPDWIVLCVQFVSFRFRWWMPLHLSLRLPLLLRMNLTGWPPEVWPILLYAFNFPGIWIGTSWLGSSTAEHSLGSLGGCKKLNINQQCDLAANTVSSFLGCINSTPRRLRDLAFIRTHLHLPLDTSDKRTIALNGENSVESCQNTQGVEEFVLRQGLRELGLCSLARSVSMGNLVAA